MSKTLPFLCTTIAIAIACKPRTDQVGSEFLEDHSASPSALDSYENAGKAPHAMPKHELHWGYDSQNDLSRGSVLPPHQWGKQYRICETGRRQSPIKFVRPKSDISTRLARPTFSVDWPNRHTRFGVLNNRHTVQANHEEAANLPHTVTFRGNDYVLQQFHYHKASEHHIFNQNSDGSHSLIKYPLEVHFVHENIKEPGNYLVIGVLGEISDSRRSVFSSEVARLRNLPNRIEEDRFKSQPLSINPLMLLPQAAMKKTSSSFEYSGDFFTYQGSLTTPPCSETVTWVVLLEPVEISMSDIEEIQNARFDNSFLNARFPFSTSAVEPGPLHNLEYFSN